MNPYLLVSLCVLGYLTVGVTFSGLGYRFDWNIFGYRPRCTDKDFRNYRLHNTNNTPEMCQKNRNAVSILLWLPLALFACLVACGAVPVLVLSGFHNLLAKGHPLQSWQNYVARKSGAAPRLSENPEDGFPLKGEIVKD